MEAKTLLGFIGQSSSLVKAFVVLSYRASALGNLSTQDIMQGNDTQRPYITVDRLQEGSDESVLLKLLLTALQLSEEGGDKVPGFRVRHEVRNSELLVHLRKQGHLTQNQLELNPDVVGIPNVLLQPVLGDWLNSRHLQLIN